MKEGDKSIQAQHITELSLNCREAFFETSSFELLFDLLGYLMRGNPLIMLAYGDKEYGTLRYRLLAVQ
mgnify:CR=1 FL=1